MIPLAAFLTVFALMYLFVAWWSNTHRTRLVYSLWFAVSLMWVVLCVAVGTHDRDLDWHTWKAWAALVGACALIPYCWWSDLHKARGRGPLPVFTEDQEFPGPASQEDLYRQLAKLADLSSGRTRRVR